MLRICLVVSKILNQPMKTEPFTFIEYSTIWSLKIKH